MDRSRFNFLKKKNIHENMNIFLFNNVNFEPVFFYIDFSLPENANIKPEDFFYLNMHNLYIHTIDIYMKKQKLYIHIKKINTKNSFFLNLIRF